MPLLLPFDFLEEDMSFDCREQGCEKKKKKKKNHVPTGSYFIRLSRSATRKRRVVYMKPVPAVDMSRAITTLV